MIRSFMLVAAVALMAGCEAKIGSDADKAGSAGGTTAEGKAEQDVVSIKAPGVDIKVNVPEAMRDDINSDGDMLYPGSNFGGMHIEAGGKGPDKGGVEIRFNSTDAPDKVAAWYRDPARKDFKVEGERRDGGAIVLNGHESDDNSAFILRLTPGIGGGTDAALSIQDSR